MQDVITSRQVNENITAVIDNLDDFYSSVVNDEKLKRRRFVIQKYNLFLMVNELLLIKHCSQNWKILLIVRLIRCVLFLDMPKAMIHLDWVL